MNSHIENRLSIDEMVAELESLKAESYLPVIKPSVDMNALITKVSDHKQLKSMTASELYEYSVLLATYSLYLNIQENRINAFVGWCERNINYIIGRNLNNTPYSFYTEKCSFIRHNEDHAIELDKKQNAALTQLEYIKYTSKKIMDLSDKLKDMAQAKSKEQRYVN